MSNRFEHLDIDYEEINKLGIVELVMLKGEKGDVYVPTHADLVEIIDNYLDEHPEILTAISFTDANNDGNIVITVGGTE